MVSDDDARADAPGSGGFEHAESRNDAVEMEDIRSRGAQPLVLTFGTSSGHAALRFVARSRGRNRVAENGNAVVVVLARAGRVRRDHCDRVTGVAQPATQRRDVDFGTAQALRVIPTEGVDDLHTVTGSVRLQASAAPPAFLRPRSGPAVADRPPTRGSTSRCDSDAAGRIETAQRAHRERRG